MESEGDVQINKQAADKVPESKHWSKLFDQIWDGVLLSLWFTNVVQMRVKVSLKDAQKQNKSRDYGFRKVLWPFYPL